MKNLLKKIIYPVLHLIREILIVLKKYSLPGLPQTLKTYEKYYIEENQKSYGHILQSRQKHLAQTLVVTSFSRKRLQRFF